MSNGYPGIPGQGNKRACIKGSIEIQSTKSSGVKAVSLKVGLKKLEVVNSPEPQGGVHKYKEIINGFVTLWQSSKGKKVLVEEDETIVDVLRELFAPPRCPFHHTHVVIQNSESSCLNCLYPKDVSWSCQICKDDI